MKIIKTINKIVAKTETIQVRIDNNKKECKYCNPDMSFGNDKLFKDDDIQVFIVSDFLYLLKGQDHFAKTVSIKYCPICGKKIKTD